MAEDRDKMADLLSIIESGSFWTLSETELLHAVKREFPYELEHLKHAYSVRHHGWEENPGSPSRILYPDESLFDEVNRSLVGVLALRWLNANDYEKFTCGQPESVRLLPESFHWIRELFRKQGIINSRSYKLFALVTSMVANDLGKSTSFIKEYLNNTGNDVTGDNHDMVLHKAAQRGMVPALESLRPEFRDELKRGIKLGSEFNVGQLAQAENAPASLAPLLDLVGHEDAWNMRWMEQILDIAGAAGHEDHSGAQKLIEPIFRSYRSSYDVISSIVQGRITLRKGYDQNLSTRYDLIVSSGWQPHKPMTIDNPQDRALMRLFCIGNVANPQAADLLFNTFHSSIIGDDVRQLLIKCLNRDGTVDEPAVQPTYGPGMINLALCNIDRSPTLGGGDTRAFKQKTLAAMLRYMTMVLSEPPGPEMIAQGDVTVIERDCRVAIRHIIESEEFMSNPDMLDDAPLPKDAVANRARNTYRS